MICQLVKKSENIFITQTTNDTPMAIAYTVPVHSIVREKLKMMRKMLMSSSSVRNSQPLLKE